MAVSNQATDNVDHEVGGAAMPGMLNLGDVLELVNDGFDNGETDITFASDLVDLQRLLSRWKLGWSELWANEAKRQEMAILAQQWCDRIHGQGELLAS